MPDELSARRQRLLLNLDIISEINEALKRMDDKPEEPLETIHGGVYIQIVKGEFVYVKPDRSYPVQSTRKHKRKTA